ncbi:MAG: hypothetical protein KAW41_05525 [Candidatus Diapherotrites archaeon]|nr:hypothetical protein [Candidatus Diapherotrites archaeon]
MRIDALKKEPLDIKETRERIRQSVIVFTPHVTEIEERQGRPPKEKVLDFFENRLTGLKKAEKARKGRTLLVFHGSRTYDLRVVVRFRDNHLIVISYNWLRKKKRKSRFNKRRIPEAKKK